MFMQDYDLVWDNRPGSQMGPADALSRRDEVDTSLDNTAVTMLPTISDVLIRALDVRLAERIAEFTATDPLVKDATDAMAKHSSLFPRAARDDWMFLDGALYYKSRLYVPEPARQELVHSLHCSQAGGHGGYFRTVHLVQRDYWWPGLTTFVRRFVAGCATCQANKVNTHPTVPGLCPISSSASRPFQQISCDMITDLPPSSGFDSVLVVVDHGLTKGVIFIPCHKAIDAAGIAALFFKHVFARFGLHDKVISDRGPQFASAFAKELARLLEYDVALSTAYHPQTDGESERVNQELETYLRIFCQGQPSKWSDLLPMAEFSHNSATHSVTNQTPFSLMMGFEPRAYPTIGKTFFPALDKRLELLDAARKEASAAHAKAAQAVKERIGAKFTPWKVGTKVWLDSRNLKINFPSRKLAPRREGPFEISQVISPYAYRLRLPPTWKIHGVFHASLLSPYKETPEFGPNFIPLPSTVIEGEEEYEVETIRAHRGAPGRRQYLVSWKGYSRAEDTWEPESHLVHARFILQAYKLGRPKDFPTVTSL